VSYVAFFIVPVFLSHQVMQMPVYLPVAGRPSIGGDLVMQLRNSNLWFILHDFQEWKQIFPPVSGVLFLPLLALPFRVAYVVVAAVSLTCFALATTLLPWKVNRDRMSSALLVLVVATGLVSYGLQFELERGQWNVIAASLAMAAAWLFRGSRRARWTAYVLFTVAVQLKLWPFIFVLMLADDWSAWKANLRRWAVLAVVNAGLFLAFGWQVFLGFTRIVSAKATAPSYNEHNHSIKAFLTYVSHQATLHGIAVSPTVVRGVEIALLALVAACVVTILAVASRRREKAFNSHLLLTLTLGACLVPSVSHDYKLSIVVAPVAVFLTGAQFAGAIPEAARPRWVFAALAFVFALAYSSTLVSYAYKPLAFANNAPVLLTMLVAVTALYVWFPPGEPGAGTSGRVAEPEVRAS
jgi:hypothetical protein